MRKIIFIMLLSLAVVSCKKENTDSVEQETFVLSDKMLETTNTVVADSQVVTNELDYYGKITADNNKLIEVYPVVGGNVTKVFVELGDFVKKGQLLATIRSTEVAAFEKDLDDAKNDVLVAQKNLKVAEELFDGNINTEKDVIEAKSNLDKAKSQLQRVQETFSIYSIQKGAIYEVRSPLTGFIIEKNINQDMLLRSDKTDNIFDIAEINDVWAIANVNESDISRIKLGIDARVTTLSYPDKVFNGHVDKIFNIIDPDTKSMKVTIKLNNENFLLKPEMRANIRLSYDEDYKLIAVPSSVIIFDKSKHFVMVYKDRNNIETRQVEIFRQVGDTTFIKEGLKSGEKVISTNQLLIYDALND